jgi:hypothetical protein
MKRLCYLFFALLILLGIPSTASPQGRISSDRSRQSSEMLRHEDIERRSQDLNALELEKKRKNNAPDLETMRRLEIMRNIRELNENGDALMDAFKSNKNDLKDTAKFAEKIAKSSKRLRQELIAGKSVNKVEPIAVSDSGNRETCLRQMAENIDNLIDKVLQKDFVRIVDVEMLEETENQLKTIESHALSFRELAKRKD